MQPTTKLAGVFLCLVVSIPAISQATNSDQDRAAAVRELQEEVRELRSVVLELRAESVRYREETTRLRTEVQRQSAAQNSPALCKLVVSPMRTVSETVQAAVSKLKYGDASGVGSVEKSFTSAPPLRSAVTSSSRRSRVVPPISDVRIWQSKFGELSSFRASKGARARTSLMQPPRSLKSITISVAYVAWRLGHDPSLRVVVVSYSAELAADLSDVAEFTPSKACLLYTSPSPRDS